MAPALPAGGWGLRQRSRQPPASGKSLPPGSAATNPPQAWQIAGFSTCCWRRGSESGVFRTFGNRCVLLLPGGEGAVVTPCVNTPPRNERHRGVTRKGDLYWAPDSNRGSVSANGDASVACFILCPYIRHICSDNGEIQTAVAGCKRVLPSAALDSLTNSVVSAVTDCALEGALYSALSRVQPWLGQDLTPGRTRSARARLFFQTQ